MAWIVALKRGDVLELHLDTVGSRILGNALVKAAPWGRETVDLGCKVRVVVHGALGATAEECLKTFESKGKS